MFQTAPIPLLRVSASFMFPRDADQCIQVWSGCCAPCVELIRTTGAWEGGGSLIIAGEIHQFEAATRIGALWAYRRSRYTLKPACSVNHSRSSQSLHWRCAVAQEAFRCDGKGYSYILHAIALSFDSKSRHHKVGAIRFGRCANAR